MLTFRSFLLEYLTDAQREQYKDVQMTPKARADTDHFFGVGNDKIQGEIHQDAKSEIHRQIEKHLGQDISHEDYKRGTIKDRHGRDTKIGRLIKDESLRVQFDKDLSRNLEKGGQLSLKTTTVRGTEVAGQTNPKPTATHPKGHSWEDISCKNIEDGINKHYLHGEIKHGTVVHFVHDHNGQEIYRATLQPHHNSNGDVAYSIDSEYGIKHPDFTRDAQRVADKLSGEYKPGIFSKHEEVYDDNRQRHILHPAVANHLDKVLDRGDYYETELALKHPKLSADHISMLLKKPGFAEHQTLIQHPNVNGDHIHKMVADKKLGPYTMIDALNHPKIRPETADMIADQAKSKVHNNLYGEEYLRAYHHAIATKTSPDYTNKAFHTGDSVDKIHAIRNPNIDSKTLDSAVKDEDLVDGAVKNPKLSHQQIHTILDHPVGWIRKGVYNHPNLKPDHIQRVLDKEDNRHHLTQIIRHPKATPANIDRALDDDMHDETKEAAAAHRNASAENLHKALRSGNSYETRTAALNNPNIRAEHLVPLVSDPEHWIRERALSHPKMDEGTIHKLLDHPDPEVRRETVLHATNINHDHLNKAVNDPDPGVATSAMINPRARLSHYDMGLSHPSERVRDLAKHLLQ